MKNIIKENKQYILSKQIYNRNYYLDKFYNFVNTKNVLVVEWQRRVWKSSVVISFLQSNNKELNKVFYINKELDLLNNIKNAKDLDEIFDFYKTNYEDPTYIVIDEIQDIQDWEKFIRKYQALWKYKIIITWSNSKLLSWELSTYLTGRYLSLEIFSFDYSEFIDFKWLSKWKDSFKEYLQYGWMPEILQIEDQEIKKNYLQTLLSNIILKDIISRYNIRDIKLIEKILAFLSNNIWSLVSITNISNYLKNQFQKEYSTKTIANYMNYLIYPYIINETQRYDIKGKKILEYVSKYYFTDIGIANNFGFVFAKDISKILENIVYLQLRRKWYKVYVWENKNYEIDFIAEKKWEKKYIQVCYLLSSQKTIQREFGNLQNIKDNYPKYVISMDDSFGNSFDWIENINIIDWLIDF